MPGQIIRLNVKSTVFNQLLKISYIGEIKDMSNKILQISVQPFRLQTTKFHENPWIVADVASNWILNAHNFVKCYPILNILSPMASVENFQ